MRAAGIYSLWRKMERKKLEEGRTNISIDDIQASQLPVPLLPPAPRSQTPGSHILPWSVMLWICRTSWRCVW